MKRKGGEARAIENKYKSIEDALYDLKKPLSPQPENSKSHYFYVVYVTGNFQSINTAVVDQDGETPEQFSINSLLFNLQRDFGSNHYSILSWREITKSQYDECVAAYHYQKLQVEKKPEPSHLSVVPTPPPEPPVVS